MMLTGYGLNKLSAACEDCLVDRCSSCEADPSVCDDCEPGFVLTKTVAAGLGATAGFECTPVSSAWGGSVPGRSHACMWLPR